MNGTRRRWTLDEKLQIVKEAGGWHGGVMAYARERQLSPAMIYKWTKGNGLGSSGRRASTPPPPPRKVRGPHNATLEERRLAVERAEASGNVAQWCKDNGVPVSSFYNWRKTLLTAGARRGNPKTQAAAKAALAPPPSARPSPIEKQMEELQAQNVLLKAIVAVANRHGLLGDLFDLSATED